MNRADHELIQQVLDGEVTPKIFEVFQQRLREEPELWKLYQEYALLHHTLSEEFEVNPLTEPATPSVAQRLLGVPLLLAVGCLLAMLAGAWWYHPWKIQSDGSSSAMSIGRFRAVVSGPFEKSQWRVAYGNPSITGQRIEGQNYALFYRLPAPEPAANNGVLLATLQVGQTIGGEFHTDGWAGMSFYVNGKEVLFFGDSFGAMPTWSLDVKQNQAVILPQHPVTGPRTVTLCYDARSGDVTLHEGAPPLKSPFCAGKIPPGTRFEEIRIGASAGASLTVNALTIQVGDD